MTSSDITSLKECNKLAEDIDYIDFSKDSSIKRIKSNYLLLCQTEVAKMCSDNNELED